MERTKLFGWGFFIIIVTARDNSIFNTGVCGELFGWLVFLLGFFFCVVFFFVWLVCCLGFFFHMRTFRTANILYLRLPCVHLSLMHMIFLPGTFIQMQFEDLGYLSGVFQS